MRVSRNLLASGISACVSMALAAAPAHADRRSSLHGNLLLEDVTDIFAMPQLMLDYRNLMRVHVGSDFDTGDGILIFGSDAMVFGIVAHRSDNTSPFGALQTPGVASPALLRGARGYDLLGSFPGPHTAVDLMMSMKMGDAASLGFRLGLAHGGASVSPEEEDAVGASQTSILLGAGYTSKSSALRTDLAFNASIGIGSDTTAGVENERSGNDINLGLVGRFYLPMGPGVELGVLGNLGLGFGGNTQAFGNSEASSSAFDFNIAAATGPVFSLEKARIGAYAFIGLDTSSRDPNTDLSDDENSTLTFVIPGVHMAMEVDVVEWFRFRAGLEYRWVLDSESDTTGSASTQTGGFGWSGGFGLVFDKFTLDFALQNSFFTTGPHFLGGGSGFASSMAAAYRF